MFAHVPHRSPESSALSRVAGLGQCLDDLLVAASGLSPIVGRRRVEWGSVHWTLRVLRSRSVALGQAVGWALVWRRLAEGHVRLRHGRGGLKLVPPLECPRQLHRRWRSLGSGPWHIPLLQCPHLVESRLHVPRVEVLHEDRDKVPDKRADNVRVDPFGRVLSLLEPSLPPLSGDDRVGPLPRTQDLAREPFAALDWPDKVDPEPDPFTEEERDILLDYYWRKDRHWFPFVFTQFFTGLRPGEAIGLRCGLDLRRGRLSVRASRTLGEDNPPKTKKSKRTITVRPEVIAVLRDMPQPLHVTADDFVFTTATGRPVDEERFVQQHWHRALRATAIRPRKFYATRHTFISASLEAGTISSASPTTAGRRSR